MIRLQKSFFIYKAPAFLWALFIFYLLTIPGRSLPDVHILNADKLAHASVFFIQAILLYRALIYPSPLIFFKRLTPVFTTSVLTFLYGVLSEEYQSFVPDRTPEVLDAIANSFGIVFFLIAIWMWRKRRHHHANS